MWSRVAAGVCAAWATLGAAPPDPQPAGHAPVTDPEAYAVYASLLPDHWLIEHARAKLLVFQEETSTRSPCSPAAESANPEWRDVVESFRSVNGRTHALRSGERLGYPYVVVPEATIRAIFDYSDTAWIWVDFAATFPGSEGYITVSAVGFDEARTRAMVYLAHHCGFLCGGGFYYYLEKSEGQWRKVRPTGVPSCVWMS